MPEVDYYITACSKIRLLIAALYLDQETSVSFAIVSQIIGVARSARWNVASLGTPSSALEG